MANPEKKFNLNQGGGCNLLSLVEGVRAKKKLLEIKKQTKWSTKKRKGLRFNSELDRELDKRFEGF